MKKVTRIDFTEEELDLLRANFNCCATFMRTVLGGKPLELGDAENIRYLLPRGGETEILLRKIFAGRLLEMETEKI